MLKKIDTLNDITSEVSPLRRDLSEELFQKLPIVMNRIHGTDFSERFWKIILERHVNAVISRKGNLGQNAIKRRPDLFPFNKRGIPCRKEIIKQRVIDFVKHLKSRKYRKQIKRTLEKDDKVRIGFFEYPELDTERIGERLPVFHPFPITFGDKNKRSAVNKIAAEQEDVYFSNVVRELPRIAVEHFEQIYNSIDLFSPHKKEIHLHTTQSTFNEYLIAKYVEHGAKLIWYQHGCNYGEFKSIAAHHFEHSVSDEYRTWGWKIKEKDVPWKAYRLEKFRQDYPDTSVRKDCDLLIAYSTINAGIIEEFKYVTDYLLTNLDPAKYGAILARPQPSNKIHSHRRELGFIEDDRVIKTSGLAPMAKDMARCRVVLQMKVPSTNFLECLYVDHPTIGLLHNDHPTEIIEPYYDFFKRAGVLHDSLESLVMQLNTVNVESWWREVTDRREFRDFKKRFARAEEIVVE